MSNLKIDIIKKVMMLDTRQELQNVLDVVGNSISRELDNDEKDQKEFAKWKEIEREKRGIKDEITF